MGKLVNERCLKTGVIFDVSLKRIYVNNIKTLTNDQIAVLSSGDEVIKQTGNQKHTYIVSYKEDGQGMCLTYTDASVVETVSYDLINGVWTYNSTDSTSITGGGGGGTTYEAGTGIDITGSTISVDTSVISTKIYTHKMRLTMLDNCDESMSYDFCVNTSRATQYDATSFKALFGDDGACKYMYECYYLDTSENLSYHCEVYYNDESDKFSIYTIASKYYSDTNSTLASISDTPNAL